MKNSQVHLLSVRIENFFSLLIYAHLTVERHIYVPYYAIDDTIRRKFFVKLSLQWPILSG